MLSAATVEPQYTVTQPPRLQLGDAPLLGFSGSHTDQVELLWQTVSGGSGTQDRFSVEYRRQGSTVWKAAPTAAPLDTGVESRMVHAAAIKGLAYDAEYEYRVRQLRGDAVIAAWQHSFHTRLAAGDDAAFSFVAYGDSANVDNLGPFRQVQGRINQIDPALAILLGDNAYETGTHAELDARFDPTLNPEAAQWNAGQIDYASFGNHDEYTDTGAPTEAAFSVPLPVAGATAPAALPPGERPEHNYSFDYGNVHFTTFDTNSSDESARLDVLLQWVEADLRASTAPWKIVFGHHPVGGMPDKTQGPQSNYYKQLVPRLRAAGADLFLGGHSHTASWTYPLLGQQSGQAIFVLDTDKDYAKGAGLVQVVAGVGGRSLRPGSFSQFPFVVAGYSSDTSPPSEFGFMKIDVTAARLTVSYIAADDGAVIDQFTISAQPAAEPAVVGRYVFYNNSAWDNPAWGLSDDNAIARDKRALRPGETAALANYTSFSRGVNGIMVDIAGRAGPITADDFLFRVGNHNSPSLWAVAPPPESVSVRPGAGTGGSDRVTIVWLDGAIQKQWLQVTVLAGANTGLAQNDVFCFGNAIGESGNSAADARVNAIDLLVTRNNPRSFLHPAPIGFASDFNRDARVDAIDLLIARNHQTSFLTELRLISAPASPAAGQASVARQARERGIGQEARAWLAEFVAPRPRKPRFGAVLS